MRLHSLVLIILGAVALVGELSAETSSNRVHASQEQPPRRIRWEEHLTITEQLRPDDEVVVVEMPDGDDVVKDGIPTPKSELSYEVQNPFANIAIVELKSAAGVLALNDTWVQTKLDVIVREVLLAAPILPATEKVAVGRSLDLRLGGGEIQIGKVKVRAGTVASFLVGRRYLVFLGRRNEAGSYTFRTEGPFLLEGNKLTAVPPNKSLLSGLSLSDVREEIRKAR